MDKIKNAVAVFDKRADAYQEKFMDVGLYKDALDLFCRLVQPRHAHILEVACGPGNLTCYLLEQRPDFNLLGTDLSPKMLQLARSNNPAATFREMDARAIHTLATPYDGIVCGFGLPYFSAAESAAFIKDAAALLSPGGVLYISTMEGDAAQSGWEQSSYGDRLYIHYHAASLLLQALTDSHLSIVDLQRKTYPGKNGVVTDLIIISQKN